MTSLRPVWYDRQGNPITLDRWGELHERDLDPDGCYGANSYVQVAQDVVRDVTISTVWLGIDHGFGAAHRPVIFETMIFGGEHDNAVLRYCTEIEAIEGHREAVIDVTAGMTPWWRLNDEDWLDAWVMRVQQIAKEMDRCSVCGRIHD